MMGGLSYMTGPEGPAAARRHLGQRHHGRHVRRDRRARRAARARPHRPRPGDAERAVRELRVPVARSTCSSISMTGEPPPPMPSRVSAWSVYDVFTLADGEQLFIGAVSDKQFLTLCRVLDAPGPRRRPGACRPTRSASRCGPSCCERLGEILQHHTIDELSPKLEAAGIPYAPIVRPEQLVDDPHLKASGGLVPMQTDDGGTTDVVLLPLLLGGRRPGVRRAAAARRRAHRRRSSPRARRARAPPDLIPQPQHHQGDIHDLRSTRRSRRCARCAALGLRAAHVPSHAARASRCASSCRSAPAPASTPSSARVGPALTKALGGQPVVIENLPGAGGITGTTAIVKAAPDGNTIGVVSNNHVDQPERVQEDAVRRAQRHHADHRSSARRRSCWSSTRPRCRRRTPRSCRRCAQGQARRLQLRVVGQRHDHPPGRRDVRRRGRRRRASTSRTRASGRWSTDLIGGQVEMGVRRGAGGAGAPQERRAARDRRRWASTRVAVAARRADDGRAGLPRLSTSPAGSPSSARPSCRRREVKRMHDAVVAALRDARGQGGDGQAGATSSTRRRPRPPRSSSRASRSATRSWSRRPTSSSTDAVTRRTRTIRTETGIDGRSVRQPDGARWASSSSSSPRPTPDVLEPVFEKLASRWSPSTARRTWCCTARATSTSSSTASRRAWPRYFAAEHGPVGLRAGVSRARTRTRPTRARSSSARSRSRCRPGRWSCGCRRSRASAARRCT